MATQPRHLFRGVLAGAIGGLVASWVMNQFQAGLSKTVAAVKQPQSGPESQASSAEPADDATMKTADALANTFTGRHLTKQEKQAGGPIVHYSFGALMGALYGGVAEYSPSSRIGAGTLFGTVLFVGADEIAIPALGLSGSSGPQPLSSHLPPWLAHLVYGSTVEFVRRGVRSML